MNLQVGVEALGFRGAGSTWLMVNMDLVAACWVELEFEGTLELLCIIRPREGAPLRVFRTKVNRPCVP